MGRVKTTAIKNLAKEIMSEHGKKFSASFDDNKKIVNKVRPIKSKKVRNVVAGYITKHVKKTSRGKSTDYEDFDEYPVLP